LEKALREKNRGEHRKPPENRGRGKGEIHSRNPERGGKAPPEKGKRVLIKTGRAKDKTGPAKTGPRKLRSVTTLRPEGPHPGGDD
jgi:hypothetical protein